MASNWPRYRRMRARLPIVQEGEHELPKCDYAIKAILLGDVGVGKTTFLHTFQHGRNPPRLTGKDPKVGNPVRAHRICRIHDKTVRLTLWDTGGQERYRSLTASYFRGAHACIIMYDTADEDSLENVKYWLETAQEYSDTAPGLVSVLVGNTRGQGDPHVQHDLTIPSSSTTPSTSGSGTTATVDTSRVASLAEQYHVSLVDTLNCRHRPQDLDSLVDALVTMIISKAQEDRHFSLTIRPQAVNLGRGQQHKGSGEAKEHAHGKQGWSCVCQGCSAI